MISEISEKSFDLQVFPHSGQIMCVECRVLSHHALSDIFVIIPCNSNE